jgi:hypothetical protein
MDNKPANNLVKVVVEETNENEEGVTFLNIYLEKEEVGREITADLIAKGEPTLAEQWGHELMGFIEDFLRRQIDTNEINGHVLTVPVKKDMN